MNDNTVIDYAALSDEYWNTYQERLAADKVARALKTKEEQLHAQLISAMQAAGLTAVGGRRVRLSLPILPDHTPMAEDWDQIWQYVHATNDTAILQRRLSTSAIKERWDNDVEIPGVGSFPVFRLSKSGIK